MIKELKQITCSREQCPHWIDPCCKLCTEIVKLDDKPIDLFLVGMGAGKSEDINLNAGNLDRQPWVGKAGKYLRSIIKWMWDNGMVFNIALSNTVRCHPRDEQGKDREPNKQEIAMCIDFLYNDIVTINPKVIIACGKSASHSILLRPIDETIGAIRGKIYTSVFPDLTWSQIPDENKIEWPVMPTYHSSYLTRIYGTFKPKEKNPFDWKMISDIITALKFSREGVPNVSAMETFS